MQNVNEQAIKALQDCLTLIADMSKFVNIMALQDYALLNEAPINAERAIKALQDDLQIDTSDIPEASDEFFKNAKLVMPKKK
jgi:hypothetical protein